MTDTELETRETFLRAIFDSPDDPTPRLIYADWLEDRGDETANYFRENRLPIEKTLHLTKWHLRSANEFRRESVGRFLSWFGASRVVAKNVRIMNADVFDLLETAPATRRIQEFIADGSNWEDMGMTNEFVFTHINVVPVVTNAAVEFLARHRFARRLTSLNLCNNDLGNDAARAIARSPYLDNLKSLQLMEGNRIRGRVWQEVVERFGEDVCS